MEIEAGTQPCSAGRNGSVLLISPVAIGCQVRFSRFRVHIQILLHYSDAQFAEGLNLLGALRASAVQYLLGLGRELDYFQGFARCLGNVWIGIVRELSELRDECRVADRSEHCQNSREILPPTQSFL
jgi:hypothetical protein